jgi:predicted HTH domain antitoxin
MDTLTVEELKQTPSRLVEDAARGEVALVVDQEGLPAFFAMPVDEALLTRGAKVALAMRLFDQEIVGLEGAARMAGISQSEMIDCLGAARIPVVRYGPGELEAEIANAMRLVDRG